MDIAYCTNKECTIRLTCSRSKLPSKSNVIHFEAKQNKDGSCDYQVVTDC